MPTGLAQKPTKRGQKLNRGGRRRARALHATSLPGHARRSIVPVSPIREACHVAAKWWSEFLTKKPGRDNGDTSEAMAFVSMLEALTPRQSPNDGQIEAFVRLLADSIWDEVEAQRARGWARPSMWLSVDYHPDAVLSGVCEVTGIRPDRLPWKTCMWLDENPDGLRINVAVGYGARTVTIWPKSEVTP